MAEDPIKHLQGKVATAPLFLNFLQKSYTLNVMKKTTYTMGLTQFGKETFPIMTEWRMADIMAQSNGLRQIFIESQKAGDGPGNFADQLHMQHPMGDMIILDKIENLGFVDVSGIGHRMKNSVRVQRKVLPVPDQDPILLPPSYGIAA